ncbi:unnamed protein product [Microthlaspi erraticum]|uniref:Ubiquitin-like protease family profile domain-containing protein n=1 Tax=Microthlaspi erraticum TaxID=1685480 RepID=A0A6D2IU67_9BRAS|nr:unnamed protein product [Microthlaspi erraticum]CAA7044165.1 unnamed protein product [Microthlaspi erraticum]
MMPYVLRELADIEDRENYLFDKFTFERVKGVPQQDNSGDCGVFTLKYIECHALGIPFTSSALCRKKIKAIRAKMACDIFHETKCKGPVTRSWAHLDAFDEPI